MKVPVPDLDLQKRPRDDFTDKLIKEALEEEQLAKKAKKAQPQPHRKGKTLAEVEQEEGGPVKTSLQAMAHVKRAVQRKARPDKVDEAALVDDADAEVEEGPDEETLRDLLGDAPLPSASTKDAVAAAAGAPSGRARRQKPSSMDIDTGAGAEGAAAEGGKQQQEEDDESEAAPRDLAALQEEGAGPAAGTYGVTAFNMKEERQEGEFDAEGNWVFKKPEEADDTDAWLASGEAQPVSDKVRAMAEARAAAMAAAEEAPVLGEAAVAGAQRQLAELLQPGESVAGALRRLGAAAKKRPLTKRDRLRQEEEGAGSNGAPTPAAAAAAAGDGAQPDAAAAAAQLARVTELADLLLSAGGELDVYSHRKEQLERWAAAVLPAAPLPDAGDDDMFASDDEAAPAAASAANTSVAPPAAGASHAAPNSSSSSQPPATSSQQQQTSTAAAAAGPGPSSGAGQGGGSGGGGSSSVDYATWPIKELRRFCQERGVDPSGIVEKQELVATVARLAAAGPQGEPAALPPIGVTPPEGYTWDASAGYYCNAASGLYWDASTGGYYNPSDGKWYAWDAAAAQYVPWT